MSKNQSKGAWQAECQSTDSDDEETDQRGTPAHIIRRLHEALGEKFGLDPAAGAEPIQIAKERYTAEDNGLAQPWNADTVFLNPPYSDPLPWFKKALSELDRDAGPELIIALVKCDVSTEWFQSYATDAEYLCAYHERISFVGADGDAPFGSTLLAFADGDAPRGIIEAFDDFGAVYQRKTLTAATEQARLGDLINDGGAAAVAGGAAAGPGAAPPTSGCGISLDRFAPTDTIEITFATDSLGSVPNLPETVTVEPLPGGREIAVDAGRITVDCLGENALPDGRDLYVQITEEAYKTTSVEVVVSADGRPWELAPVVEIDTVSSDTPSCRQPVA